MQFIKTICVIVVLGALAYGAYTTLTGKPKSDPPVDTVNWVSPDRIELPSGGDVAASNSVAAPAGPAGGAAPKYGENPTGGARIVPGGPLTGANPSAGASTTPSTSAPAAAAAAPLSYPITKAVPGPFDGGGAVHLVSNTTPTGAASSLATTAGGSSAPLVMPSAAQPSSAAQPAGAADLLAKGQACLAKGDYLHALDEFSKCFDNPSLSPAEASRLQELLDQLAGTVIYSREHLIEPAHVLAPGESLLAIAQQHQVPLALLAKINGISDPRYLPPGTQLKMVKGPFDAVVDKSHGKLTLFVDGMYAGSFPLTPGFSFPDGKYTVEKIVKGATMGIEGPSASRVHGLMLSGGVAICGTDDPVMTPNGDPTAGVRGLSLRDADDVFDILSIGSKVVVRP